MSSLDWRPVFPLSEPRPEQARALDKIIEHIVGDDAEFVVAELGTGIGKSAIAVTLGRWFDRYHDELKAIGIVEGERLGTYVLTSQKVLQDQYVRDFPTLTNDLRSSANFGCTWLANQTCAETLRIKEALKETKHLSVVSCSSGHVCPYKESKKNFVEGPIGVTNYSYMLSETVYAGGLKPRDLLICDEAHNIESEVRRWATVSIKDVFAKTLKLKVPADDEALLTWIETKYAPAVNRSKDACLSKIERSIAAGSFGLLRDETRKFEVLDKHICQVNRFIQEKGSTKDNYLIARNDAGVDLKPLDVSSQSRKLLYSKARRKLLMSATVLDKGVFSRSTGIPKKTKFVEEMTPFASKSFGISFRPVGLMSSRGVIETTPKIIKEIKKILAAHPDDKGIIHTSSYAVTRTLASLNDNRLLIQQTSDDRNRLLREHLESPRPTVLVSPAMMEGLDLHGDLGRFQVVCKVPFPYMGDEVVKVKMKRDPKWYAWCTVRTLVQSVGRCVRSKDDWAKTYILDECFWRLLETNAAMFPSYFQDMEVVDILRT